MEDFDSEDVSTVFSLFDMDSLFSRYKQNDVDANLEVTAGFMAENLQSSLKLEFSEAVELLWKLKLLENGEKGTANHLSKCSICSSTNPAAILKEYGMKEEDRNQIVEKMKEVNWKGFYFAAANVTAVTSHLRVADALKPRVNICWLRIQKAHNWQ